MKCLDTYALVEIIEANPTFLQYLDEDFLITGETLAEFVWVLSKDQKEEIINEWITKLEHYSRPVTTTLLIRAMKFRRKNKSKNLSFFDCVGYIYSLENKIPFVTGDKEFKILPGVEFVK